MVPSLYTRLHTIVLFMVNETRSNNWTGPCSVAVLMFIAVTKGSLDHLRCPAVLWTMAGRTVGDELLFHQMSQARAAFVKEFLPLSVSRSKIA